MATSRTNQQDTMAALDEDESLDEEEDDLPAMSLVEHLEELRRRIFKSLIAIVIGAIVAFIFREPIVHFLELPLPKEADAIGHGKLVVTGIAEGFTVFLKVSVAAGFLLAIPVVLYQVWAFIAPAVPFIFIGIFLFVAGIALGYVVMRYPVEWLVAFASNNFTELVTADSYFTFVAFFMLAFGIVFEIPLVLTFLAKVGLITSETLRKRRAASHVGMWIAATFLTPGADLYSPIILGVAMSCLYELTILFIRITNKLSTEQE